jgi:hypothetical protein
LPCENLNIFNLSKGIKEMKKLLIAMLLLGSSLTAYAAILPIPIHIKGANNEPGTHLSVTGVTFESCGGYFTTSSVDLGNGTVSLEVEGPYSAKTCSVGGKDNSYFAISSMEVHFTINNKPKVCYIGKVPNKVGLNKTGINVWLEGEDEGSNISCSEPIEKLSTYKINGGNWLEYGDIQILGGQ